MAHASFREAIIETRPERIEELWDEPESADVSSLQHNHAEHMEWWCSDAEISDFIADTTRVNNLLTALGWATVLLGQCMQQAGIGDAPNLVLLSSCQGCNTPYDNGGCVHISANRPPPVRKSLDNPILIKHLHTASITVAIVSHLLTHTEADKVVNLILDRETVYGMSRAEVYQKLQNQNEILNMPAIMPSLLGLMDNCSFAFPKLVHKAVGLMSLVICRYPARALGCLDHHEFVQIVVDKYLSSVFGLIHNSQCAVEETYGTVALINLLPALYYFGPWQLAHSSRDFPTLVACFASIIINVCHSATRCDDGDEWDAPIDLDAFPELTSAKVLIRPLLVSAEGDSDNGTRSDTEQHNSDWRLTVLRSRPMSFLVASGLEILGWWSYKGVDFSRSRIPGAPGEIITIPDSIDEYLPRIRQLVSRTPSLAYMVPLAEALARGETSKTALAPLVKQNVLLYGPLMDANRRCGYCRAPQPQEKMGRDLLRCGGGCSQMEQYCCKEHQQAHWKVHKAFCKANKKK